MLWTQTLILLLSLTSASARRTHNRLIIHVPFRIKTHHHTHTVYSHIRSASSDSTNGNVKGSSSGGTKQTIYKILSFAMQGKGYAGHTGHGGGGGGGHAGHAGHKNSHGGGGGGYEHEHNGGHAGAYDHSTGDIMYDDYHGGVGGARAERCIEGPHGYGDMIFNHFSRSSDESNESDEYPVVEEYVDEDEQGIVWE